MLGIKNLFWTVALMFIKNILFKDTVLEVEWPEHFPCGAFILVSNCDHAWTPTILVHILHRKRRTKTHFFTRSFLFRSLISRLFLNLMEQIPVEPGNRTLNEKAFGKAKKYLKKNEAVGIFPFPFDTIKISPLFFPYKIIKRKNTIYPGVIRLLQENPVPLVPMHVHVYQNRVSKSFLDKNFKKVKITVGMPIKNAYFNKHINKEEKKQMARKLMDKIYGL